MSMKSVFFLLSVICFANSVNAQLPSFWPNVTQCLSTLKNISGCFEGITQSILTGKIGTITPYCCRLFLGAVPDCLELLPVNPFPPMLMQKCSHNI
ncbi:hypothetical protein BRARA_J02285 [Brassica rapa]|uniref:Prolamin-like domain-containing protein n=1 Tax=Brassica campestris TaxID=3711 RepID=A0A397XVA3_BRACM|nr:hypothetical protein BRARA_J02285 [Brassica rapa]